MVDLHALTCWMTIRKQGRKVTGDGGISALYLAGIDVQDKLPADPGYKMGGFGQHRSLFTEGDNPWSWRLEQLLRKAWTLPKGSSAGMRFYCCWAPLWPCRVGWAHKMALLVIARCWLLHTPFVIAFPRLPGEPTQPGPPSGAASHPAGPLLHHRACSTPEPARVKHTALL